MVKYKIVQENHGCRFAGFSILKYVVYRKLWFIGKWKYLDSFSDEGEANDFIYAMKKGIKYNRV